MPAIKVGDKFTLRGVKKDRRFKSGVRQTGKDADFVQYTVVASFPPECTKEVRTSDETTSSR